MSIPSHIHKIGRCKNEFKRVSEKRNKLLQYRKILSAGRTVHEVVAETDSQLQDEIQVGKMWINVRLDQRESVHHFFRKGWSSYP